MCVNQCALEQRPQQIAARKKKFPQRMSEHLSFFYYSSALFLVTPNVERAGKSHTGRKRAGANPREKVEKLNTCTCVCVYT